MKSRFRHPVRAIREPFGKAGLVVAVVALVFAMVGGAYAASGALTGKQKKEVEKIAKKFAGKPGPAGLAGPQGPAGANGKDGGKGDIGANGTNGKAGTTGFIETLSKGKSETGVWVFGGREFADIGVGWPVRRT